MSTTAGLGGLNSLYVAIETDYGTYEDPSGATGVWVPILDENLKYTETKYYSPQIREQTIASDVKQSFYHVEGDIHMEVDAHYLPYFLYASRHTVVKTGTGPYEYKAVPSNFGSAYPGGAAKGLSITIDRNGNGFGYAGCVVGQWAFTINNGILEVTMSMVGLSEQLPADLGTTAWIDPSLFGADATSIYTDASGTAPAFATRDNNFDGFTATFNYNAEAMNRIRPDRQATFIKFGETDATVDTTLDFLDRTDYDHMVASDTQALRMESNKPGGAGTYAAATEAIRIDFNRLSFDTYEVDTPAMGDLVAARFTGKGIGIAGGDAFSITCKSSVSIV